MANNKNWKDLDYALKKAKKIMKRENWNELPNALLLRERGYNGLTSAIDRYFGFHKFRDALGEKQRKIKDGSWKNLEFTLKQAKESMKKENWEELPSSDVLSKYGYSYLVSAITKYHKGFHKFRKLLGQKQKISEPGLWIDLGYTIKEITKVMKKRRWAELPSSDILHKLGYNPLIYAISKYHGGFHKFRKLLGQEQKKIQSGNWKSLDFTLNQAGKIMKKEGWSKLPGGRTLQNFKYSSLSIAIMKYHGGYQVFRNKLDEYLGEMPENKRLESLLEKYVEN